MVMTVTTIPMMTASMMAMIRENEREREKEEREKEDGHLALYEFVHLTGYAALPFWEGRKRKRERGNKKRGE
jgi:hypothetical protein